MNPKRVDRIPAKYREAVKSELEEFASAVRRKREAVGLTQEGLAEDLGIDPQTIAYIEQKRRFPSLPLLFTICMRLGIKIQFR